MLPCSSRDATMLGSPDPGSSNGAPNDFVVTHGELFFHGGPVAGQQLRVSDGSAIGTRLLGDTDRGAGGVGIRGRPIIGRAGGKVFVAVGSAGTLHVVDLGALAQPYDRGAASEPVPPTLRSPDPVSAAAMTLTVDQIPGGAPGGFLLSDALRPGQLISAPNWMLLVQLPAIAWGFAPTGSGHTESLAIPSSTALIGRSVGMQGFFLDPPSPAYGLALTNGLYLTIGN